MGQENRDQLTTLVQPAQGNEKSKGIGKKEQKHHMASLQKQLFLSHHPYFPVPSSAAALMDHFVSLIAAPNPWMLSIYVPQETITIQRNPSKRLVQEHRKKKRQKSKLHPRGNQLVLYLDFFVCLLIFFKVNALSILTIAAACLWIFLKEPSINDAVLQACRGLSIMHEWWISDGSCCGPPLSFPPCLVSILTGGGGDETDFLSHPLLHHKYQEHEQKRLMI